MQREPWGPYRQDLLKAAGPRGPRGGGSQLSTDTPTQNPIFCGGRASLTLHDEPSLWLTSLCKANDPRRKTPIPYQQQSYCQGTEPTETAFSLHLSHQDARSCLPSKGVQEVGSCYGAQGMAWMEEMEEDSLTGVIMLSVHIDSVSSQLLESIFFRSVKTRYIPRSPGR